ncbi:MAG TPA: UDP-N-acetylmuramoyl-L-alanine--D-glutamate ligase [Candidatus Tyrphobacter sp.]
MQDRFEHETVLVIGLGKSGLASTAVLRERGAVVFATDEKVREGLLDAIAAIEAHGARFVAPADLDEILDRITSAVLSPGIPPTSAVVRRVVSAGIPVIGEVELAWRLCGAPIVAVTGTKGKSTTTALIGALLRACARDVRVGGNIGDPLVGQVGSAAPSSWVVAEVSSFQLETIRTFRPRIAVLLNVVPDHLDRYRSLDEYADAKLRIAVNQGVGDTLVIDLDDPRLAAFRTRREREGCRMRILGYTLRDARGVAMSLHGEQICYAPPDGDAMPILDRADVPLAGEHNLRNVMAALLAALAAGCEIAPLRDAVRAFHALPHRLQAIGEVDAVLYVDDSKATNPDAAIAALTAYDRPVVLIAGGRSKGTDFAKFGAAIRARAKALIAIGESAEEIARAAGDVPHEIAESVEDAVERARRYARPGDVVLLSPACASFDMFASAEERGERFTRAVNALREGVRA